MGRIHSNIGFEIKIGQTIQRVTDLYGAHIDIKMVVHYVDDSTCRGFPTPDSEYQSDRAITLSLSVGDDWRLLDGRKHYPAVKTQFLGGWDGI
jgi:hypothetical protein